MSSSDLLSLVGWYFLPNLLTTLAQQALYTLTVRAGTAKPPPGSAKHTTHRRLIQIVIITLYLLYTLYTTFQDLYQEPDFYTLLSLPHNAAEREIQTRFRRLTVEFHPDKIPASAGLGAEERKGREEVYVLMKTARDVLVDPSKRFAYERFGAASLSWSQCSSLRDFVVQGLRGVGVYYFASAGFLLLISFLGVGGAGLREGVFWRWLVLAGMVVVEISVVTRPGFPALLTGLINPALKSWSRGARQGLLPFQFLVLLRKVAVTSFIAMAQLAPLLRPPNSTFANAAGTDAVPPQLLDRLEALAGLANEEVGRLMGLELSPFVDSEGNGSRTKELRAGLKEWLVSNTLRNDVEVKSAVEAVLERRRGGDADAPG